MKLQKKLNLNKGLNLILSIVLISFFFCNIEVVAYQYHIEGKIFSSKGDEIPLCTDMLEIERLDDESGEDRAAHYRNKSGQILAMVFDGLGSSQKSLTREFIYKLIKSLKNNFLKLDKFESTTLENLFIQSLEQVEDYKLIRASTTMDLLLIDGEKAYYYLIGDSPMFYIEEIMDEKGLRQKITKYMGGSIHWNTPDNVRGFQFTEKFPFKATQGELTIHAGDRIFLVSDGISDNIPSKINFEKLGIDVEQGVTSIETVMTANGDLLEINDFLVKQAMFYGLSNENSFKNPYFNDFLDCVIKLENGVAQDRYIFGYGVPEEWRRELSKIVKLDLNTSEGINTLKNKLNKVLYNGKLDDFTSLAIEVLAD